MYVCIGECRCKHTLKDEWYFFTKRPNINVKLVNEDGYYSICKKEEVFSQRQVIGDRREKVYCQPRSLIDQNQAYAEALGTLATKIKIDFFLSDRTN